MFELYCRHYGYTDRDDRAERIAARDGFGWNGIVMLTGGPPKTWEPAEDLDTLAALRLRSIRGEPLSDAEQATLDRLRATLRDQSPRPEPLPPEVTAAMARFERLLAAPDPSPPDPPSGTLPG